MVARSFRDLLSSLANELETKTTLYGVTIRYFEHEDGTPYLATDDDDDGEGAAILALLHGGSEE